MGKTCLAFLLLLLFAVIASCGKVRPLPKEGRAIEKRMLIFSAPWCEPCHALHAKLIPQVKAWQKSEIVTVVQTGISKSVPPTELSCTQYKDSLGAPYAFVPDPWKSTIYKQYLGQSFSIPAAVLVDAQGGLIKKFPAGSFSAQELLGYLD